MGGYATSEGRTEVRDEGRFEIDTVDVSEGMSTMNEGTGLLL